jgi:hypothetical protein
MSNPKAMYRTGKILARTISGMFALAGFDGCFPDFVVALP